ncbi:hypothetical protein, partial [Vibrio parahaemolyticus]|uniref:hypothetical protein n=1 Tax=Vibrio parahaemolyticus TaxID=670 RepID=UPI0006770BAB
QSAPFGHSGTPPGCFILEKCFPNASLKCGAHHSKLAPAVKRFSSVFTLNAAFLGKDVESQRFVCPLYRTKIYFLLEFTLLDVKRRIY